MTDIPGLVLGDTVIASGPRWVRASVRSTDWSGDVTARSAGVPQLQVALAERDLQLSDVVHLKLWVPVGADASMVLESWLEVFPDANRRPSVSVIASDLASSIAMDVTAIASRAGNRRSVYEPGQDERAFPAAAVSGDLLSVGLLSGAVPNAPLPESAEDQAQGAFARLRWILQEVGARPDGVGHMFVWYRDHAVREVVNRPFLEMFPVPGDRPARHSLVRDLPAGVALQIEVIGSVSSRRCCYTLSGVWHGGIEGVPNSLPLGTRLGEILYSAGTYGRDPDTGEIPDDLVGQQGSAIEHSLSLLHGAGMSSSAIRHVYVWLRDLSIANDVEVAVRRVLLGGSHSVPVQPIQSVLPGTNLIQIELVAVAGE
jgi:2-iminobutanoate/2-iminopropanoate deaminase